MIRLRGKKEKGLWRKPLPMFKLNNDDSREGGLVGFPHHSDFRAHKKSHPVVLNST